MKTKDIIAIILVFSIALTAMVTAVAKIENSNDLENLFEVELEKGESLYFENLVPVGQTNEGVGTIFSNDGSELWILNDFYAEPSDNFVALMNDKGTTDKTDDVIVEIWLDLE